MVYPIETSDLAKLLKTGRSYKLPKGQVLQISGRQMMLNYIIKGFIKRYSITDEGNQSIQAIYGQFEVFPLTPIYKVLFDEYIYKGTEIFYYEAITDSTVYSINEDSLVGAVKENPMLYKDLFYETGKRLSSNIQRLDNASLGSANRKVAHQLAYYAEKFGKHTNEGIEILLPLTHQTLAGVLNLARETVTHSITRLHDKKLITSNKNIIVPDIEKLRNAFH